MESAPAEAKPPPFAGGSKKAASKTRSSKTSSDALPSLLPAPSKEQEETHGGFSPVGPLGERGERPDWRASAGDGG